MAIEVHTAVIVYNRAPPHISTYLSRQELLEGLYDYVSEFEDPSADGISRGDEEVVGFIENTLMESVHIHSEVLAERNLYFIAAVDPDDLENNLDTFVWAAAPADARAAWDARYADDYRFDGKIFEVPTNPPAKKAVLEWHEDLKEVS